MNRVLNVVIVVAKNNNHNLGMKKCENSLLRQQKKGASFGEH